MNNNKIDIIIPVYKSHDILIKTLGSVAAQTTLSDLEVTLVNDCCPDGDYQEFVKMFSPYFSIQEIKTDTNNGKGMAKQKGIDETSNEYITFLDPYATYASPFALQVLKTSIKKWNTRIKIVRPYLIGINEENEIEQKNTEPNMMLGTLCRRDFIEKYNIRFFDSPAKAAEDIGFSRSISLLCDNSEEKELILSTASCVWRCRNETISQSNNGILHIDKAFEGLADNIIYAGKRAIEIRSFTDKIGRYICEAIVYMFKKQADIPENKAAFLEKSWECVKSVYAVLYTPYKDKLDSIMTAYLKELGPAAAIGIQNTLTYLEEEAAK